MTFDFAIKWAYFWTAIFAVVAFGSILLRLPLPDMPWPFIIGAVHGSLIVGPIMWVTFYGDHCR